MTQRVDKGAYWEWPDGRQVCKLKTKAGRDLYHGRIREMVERQEHICCLHGKIDGCPGRLRLADAMFEHEDGRGMNGGHRDDRIEKDGKPYNGAAHAICNSKKGSQRIKYNDELVP